MTENPHGIPATDFFHRTLLTSLAGAALASFDIEIAAPMTATGTPGDMIRQRPGITVIGSALAATENGRAELASLRCGRVPAPRPAVRPGLRQSEAGRHDAC
jgi:hypothetical protein